MKFSKEEYISILTNKSYEKPMLVELFGPLIGLEKEWKVKGANESEIDLSAFDFDYVNYASIPAKTGFHHGLKPIIIEETDEYIINQDEMGRKTKLIKKSATIPLPISFPVTDYDSWLSIKSHYEFYEDRIDYDSLVQLKKKAENENTLILANIPGGFDEPRQLFGEEALCYACYDMPELLHEILNTIMETSLKVLDRVTEIIPIDNLCIHEDMAGKSGPLIGPNHMDEFIKPYFKPIIDMLKSKGTTLFSLDTDGNCNSIMQNYIDCGINVVYPMEPASNMDIVSSYNKYGDTLGYKGGIDKHVLREDKNAIIKELEYKLRKNAPVIYGLDHRIPNGTSIENYRFYVNTAREILGREPIKNPSPHVRMAF